LTIFPRVNIQQIPNAQQSIPFSHSNRKKLHLKGCLVQGGVVPGESLSLEINLENPKRSEIKRIEAILIQHQEIAQSHHAEVIFRADLQGLCEFNGTSFHRNFQLRIPPVLLSPTYTYISQCCGPSRGVAFHYELQLEVKSRGLFTDFKVSVPVIIGTVATSDQQELMNSFAEIATASAPAYDYDEPPPSYESVVANVKQ
jgi:hypothetical protein